MRAQRPAGISAKRPSLAPRESEPAIVRPFPTIVGTAALRNIQQLAGNRAATTALLALQRDAPPQTAAEPGRIPTPQEQDQWDDPFPEDATFRILVDPTYGYNCFAWAVGPRRSSSSPALRTHPRWLDQVSDRAAGLRAVRRWSGRERRSDPLRRWRHPGAACRAEGGTAVWVAHVHQQTGGTEQVSGDLARPGGHERRPLRSCTPLLLVWSVRHGTGLGAAPSALIGCDRLRSAGEVEQVEDVRTRRISGRDVRMIEVADEAQP